MKPKDIPQDSFVAINSDLLECGFCYGHVKHHNGRTGVYSYSTIQVSSTCSFRFLSTTLIEPQTPNDLKLEYIITVK